LLLSYQERRRILENNELSDVFVQEMMGLLLFIFLFGISLLTIITGIMFAVFVYGQNSTGENITVSLSCIREFYSDKGYGEDLTKFCKK
jgi:hypothetical protein